MSITRTDQTLEHRHFRSPDEVRTFDNGRDDVVVVDEVRRDGVAR